MANAVRLNVKTIVALIDMPAGFLVRARYLKCPACLAKVRCLYLAAETMMFQCSSCHMGDGIDVYQSRKPVPLWKITAIRKRLAALTPLSAIPDTSRDPE